MVKKEGIVDTEINEESEEEFEDELFDGLDSVNEE